MSSMTNAEQKHSGAVQVRGMIRRIWRPRYLELDDNGVLRYYEAAIPQKSVKISQSKSKLKSHANANSNAGVNVNVNANRDIRTEMQAFSLPDMHARSQHGVGLQEKVRANYFNVDTSMSTDDDEDAVRVHVQSKKIIKGANHKHPSSDPDPDDHVIVDSPREGGKTKNRIRNRNKDKKNNIPKSRSNEGSIGEASSRSNKMGSWDNIHMITSSPSSSSFGGGGGENEDESETDHAEDKHGDRSGDGDTCMNVGDTRRLPIGESIHDKNIEVMLKPKLESVSGLDLDVLVDDIPEPEAVAQLRSKSKSKSQSGVKNVVAQVPVLAPAQAPVPKVQRKTQTQTLHHQIHEHRPKAVMTILSARLIDVSSLRDIHVGLPKGTHGFVFCGRQIFSERDEPRYGQNHGSTGLGYGSYGQSYGEAFAQSQSLLAETGSITGDHFEIRDDICHPLSILSVSDQYFDTSRDYLCSVGTKQEAIRWVKALKWAANMATRSASKASDQRKSTSNRETSKALAGAPRRCKGGSGGAERRKTSTTLEGNEISIRGAFQETVGSPLTSPTRSRPRTREKRSLTRSGMEDLVYKGHSMNNENDLMSSLLSDTSTVLTDPLNPHTDGYTVVAKIKKTHLKRMAWKRLVGIDCFVVFEIQLLLLNMDHLMHRSKRKQMDDPDHSDSVSWKIEERTVFRTFHEIITTLEALLSTSEISGPKGCGGLDKMLRSLKDSRYQDIMSLSSTGSELAKAVQNVDRALKEITSDPNFCDTRVVKHFLGLLPNDGSRWDVQTPDLPPRKDTIHVCVGDSIDDFVKKWLLEKEGEMSQIGLAQNYILLMLQNPKVELPLSAIIIFAARYLLSSCWSNPLFINVRFDTLLALLVSAFYIGFNAGTSNAPSIDTSSIQRSKVIHKTTTRRRRSSSKKKEIAKLLDDEETLEDEDESINTGTFETQSNNSDDSQTLSSPLPMYHDSESLSCWSRPNDKIFAVRSKTYLRNKIKLPSGPSPFKCRGADMWLTDNPERNISRFPCVLGGKLGEEDTFLVNFLLPFGNFVSYFTVPKDADMPENVAKIWNQFKNGDQMYRDARLKLLPVVIDGPWIVKKAVGPGTAPALLSQSIPLQYYFTDSNNTTSTSTSGSTRSNKKGIYEVDVIITASRIAKGILGVVKNHTKRLTIALSFIIEATTEAELPETVLGSCQLHSLNLELCPQLPKYYLDESPLGSYDDD